MLHEYFAILRKRKVIFLFAGLLFVTVFITTLLTEETFASTATVEVMPIAPKVLDVDEVEALGAGGTRDTARLYYGTQLLILKSDTVLKKSIDKIRYEHNITVFDDFEKTEDKLRNQIRVSMKPETSLITITVKRTKTLVTLHYTQTSLPLSISRTTLSALRQLLAMRSPFSSLSTSATRKKKWPPMSESTSSNMKTI